MRRASVVAVLAVLAVVAGACSSSDGTSVETARVTAGEVVQTVAAPARIEPAQRRNAAAPVSGTVDALLVEDGSTVRAGDPVVRLASSQVELGVAQAEAAVGAADALAAVPVAADLSPLVTSVRTELERTVGPLLEQLGSQAAAVTDPVLRERALAAVARASAGYESTRQQLTATATQLGRAAANANASQRAAAQAQREQAETALAAAQEQQDALVVNAPIDGVVEFARGGGGGAVAGANGDLGSLLGGASGGGGGPLAVGATVGYGQALFTVFDLSGFHAAATVDEIDVVLVATGQRATVVVDALGGIELAGYVDHVAVAPDETATGGVAYPVQVRLTGASRPELRVGMTASVEVIVRRVDSDRVIPSAALVRRDDGQAVVVVREGRARVVPVEVAATGEDTAAVEGELRTGEVVVVAGASDLQDGDPVP